MKTIRIDVTADDIRAGQKGECSRCPVAIALYRVFQHSISVSQKTMLIKLDEKQGYTTFNTPAAVSDFIWCFDHGFKCEPFSFELSIPEELF